MERNFPYETEIGAVLCQTTATIDADEIARFRMLMGYPAISRSAPAPTSMGLIFGLRLGWAKDVFPPGVIRMADEDEFGVPIKAGDDLLTTFQVIEHYEKRGKRFNRYQMETTNQHQQMVCLIRFLGLLP